MSSRVAAALFALGLVGACSKGERDGTVTLSLQGLPGLEVRAPSGTQAQENAIGIGVMLFAPRGLWGLISERTGLQLFPIRRRLIGTIPKGEG